MLLFYSAEGFGESVGVYFSNTLDKLRLLLLLLEVNSLTTNHDHCVKVPDLNGKEQILHAVVLYLKD